MLIAFYNESVLLLSKLVLFSSVSDSKTHTCTSFNKYLRQWICYKSTKISALKTEKSENANIIITVYNSNIKVQGFENGCCAAAGTKINAESAQRESSTPDMQWDRSRLTVESARKEAWNHPMKTNRARAIHIAVASAHVLCNGMLQTKLAVMPLLMQWHSAQYFILCVIIDSIVADVCNSMSSCSS